TALAPAIARRPASLNCGPATCKFPSAATRMDITAGGIATTAPTVTVLSAPVVVAAAMAAADQDADCSAASSGTAAAIRALRAFPVVARRRSPAPRPHPIVAASRLAESADRATWAIIGAASRPTGTAVAIRAPLQ